MESISQYFTVRIKRPGKELVKSRPGQRKNWGWLSNSWLDRGNVTLAVYWDGEHHWKKWQFEREHHATSVEVLSFKSVIHSHGRAQQAGRWWDSLASWGRGIGWDFLRRQDSRHSPEVPAGTRKAKKVDFSLTP